MDVQVKNKGNEYYAMEKYRAAIDKYTEAIVLKPSVSTYYTNRALCHLKLNQFDVMVKDCVTAIQLNDKNIKGYYLAGLAYMNQNEHQKGIEYFKKALQHAGLNSDGTNKLDLKATFVQEIKTELYRGKKKMYFHELKVKRDRVEELQQQLEGCLLSEPVTEEKINVLQQTTKYIECKNIDKQEVPDYFCCSISMDIMMDPVTTPNGISYERYWIEKHIATNGQIDPITRKTLTKSMLVANVNLRQAIEHYLELNPCK